MKCKICTEIDCVLNSKSFSYSGSLSSYSCDFSVRNLVHNLVSSNLKCVDEWLISDCQSQNYQDFQYNKTTKFYPS